MLHPVSKRPTVHDWRGDYVAEAVATGHPVVLELLFKQGYEITWQNAQVGLLASTGKGTAAALAQAAVGAVADLSLRAAHMCAITVPPLDRSITHRTL